jgi:hypothetical protein
MTIELQRPLVIWTGRQPLNQNTGTTFRVVDRGPARSDRLDDVPFACEQRLGVSSMKVENWGPPKTNLQQEAVYALVHAFGLLLTVDPKKLNLDHRLYCEINLAISEDRETRGCDCETGSS